MLRSTSDDGGSLSAPFSSDGAALAAVEASGCSLLRRIVANFCGWSVVRREFSAIARTFTIVVVARRRCALEF